MEHHLSSCSDCIIHFEQAIILSFSGLEKTYGEAPDVSEQVMKAIRIQPTRQPIRKPISFLHYGLTASIAFLLFHIGFFDIIFTFAGTGTFVTEQSDQFIFQTTETSGHWIQSISSFLILR